VKYSISLVFIVLFALYPIQIFAKQNCLSCHSNWYNEKIDESSIHGPFLQGKCDVCHSKTDMNDLSNQNNNDYNWILSKYIFSGITLIPFSKDKNLLIKLVNEDQEINKIFHLKVNKVQVSSIDFALPIVISNFHVISVTSDYMLHAKIAWQTNVPTKCSVYYGTSNNDKNIITEYLYSTNHILEIDGLKKNAHYYIYIVATSPLNEKLTSSTISFDTSSNFDDSAALTNNPDITNDKEIDAKLVDIGGKNYIEIASPVKAYLRVAVDDSYDFSIKNVASKVDISDSHIKPTHLCSTEMYELGYQKCLRCHRLSQYDHNSHPINITLPSCMHPPKELILARGKIVCITCHYPHASNYPHQLRMKETTLCGCCHDLKQYAGLKIAQQYQFNGNKENFSNM